MKDDSKECHSLFAHVYTGMVMPSESIFNYSNGKSASDYSDSSFEPLFIDEVDPAKLANATAECGGASASQACIFDYIATGNKALAQQSGQTDAHSNQTNAALGKCRLCKSMVEQSLTMGVLQNPTNNSTYCAITLLLLSHLHRVKVTLSNLYFKISGWICMLFLISNHINKNRPLYVRDFFSDLYTILIRFE